MPQKALKKKEEKKCNITLNILDKICLLKKNTSKTLKIRIILAKISSIIQKMKSQKLSKQNHKNTQSQKQPTPGKKNDFCWKPNSEKYPLLWIFDFSFLKKCQNLEVKRRGLVVARLELENRCWLAFDPPPSRIRVTTD